MDQLLTSVHFHTNMILSNQSIRGRNNDTDLRQQDALTKSHCCKDRSIHESDSIIGNQLYGLLFFLFKHQNQLVNEIRGGKY